MSRDSSQSFLSCDCAS